MIKANCPTASTFLSEIDSKFDTNDILQRDSAELQKIVCEIYQSAEISLKEVAEKIAFEQKISAWSEINGKINPNTLQDIYDANKFLKNLTSENFTISTVIDNKNIRSVALCKFYDFLADYHTNFFNQFIAEKQNARDKIKLGEKNEPVTSDIVSLAKFSLSDLRRTVDFQVSKIRKEHEDYKKHLTQESAQKKFEERQAFLSKLATRTNCPDAPIELALPISFESTFSHDGITAIIKGVRKQLALTPILPTKKFINPDTNLTNYEIAIRDEKALATFDF